MKQFSANEMCYDDSVVGKNLHTINTQDLKKDNMTYLNTYQGIFSITTQH